MLWLSWEWKNPAYWHVEKERAQKVMPTRLKSELLNFKAHFIYLVYLPAIFFSSEHHILSRMCNRILTTVTKDSLKIINLKRLAQSKKFQDGTTGTSCIIFVYFSVKRVYTVYYQLVYSSEKSCLRRIFCY